MPPVNSSGSCGILKTNFAVVYDTQDTTSTTYADITGAKVSFTSTKPGCVVATFSGVASAVNGNGMDVHVLLDGATICPPENYAFVLDAVSSAHSMTAVCKAVPAGSHTVQVQFISVFGGTAHIGTHTLTVGHR
jgi:hypothetical protein